MDTLACLLSRGRLVDVFPLIATIQCKMDESEKDLKGRVMAGSWTAEVWPLLVKAESTMEQK